MTIFNRCFPIGLGTARFSISGVNDEAGIENAVKIVLRALDLGVNYIDTSHIYSGGMAQTVLNRAFAQTSRPYSVTLKVQYGVDKTADDARRRAENGLLTMGINSAAFFVAWSVKSYLEFEKITKKGGIYDGALKMKKEKLIDHICISTHAPITDTIKIIESGAFEGITISYSLLNAIAVQPILDAAQANNIGVAVMNPLAGGIIPQNRDFFSYSCNKIEQNPVQEALRYIIAQPAVQIAITGCTTKQELEESINALALEDAEPAHERIARINHTITELSDFCTGCRYCDGCPKDIPIPAIMQSRNTLLFEPPIDYKRTEREILKNIALFRRMYFEYQLGMEHIGNPCIRCGQCERKCTQGLKVCNSLEDTYERAKRSGYTMQIAKNRLDSLLNKNYQKVGFYPSGGYIDYVLRLYRTFFGEPMWEILMFNSNPKMWGTFSGGYEVHAPEQITKLAPDAILINSYTHRKDIYQELQQYEKQGIAIIQLHDDNDIPWVW